VKEAAFHVMEEAYMAASANGTLPANARQIYYAARPCHCRQRYMRSRRRIHASRVASTIRQTDPASFAAGSPGAMGPDVFRAQKILHFAERDSLDSQYFCQTLLVDYMRERGVDWNVVWDDRGHFVEPHTGRSVGLGTLNVRKYLSGNRVPEFLDAGFAAATIKTHGPDGCFGALLFIEKEGFMPLFEAAEFAEKHHIAIMSSKGMSVTAARQLADAVCSKYNIPLVILHDFDVAGFSIAKTVGASTARYNFKNRIKVIDLGLRLEDVGLAALRASLPPPRS
jgi:hypothetical protein